MTDPKLSGDNPHFRSKFVPLDEVLAACVTPCLDAGLFVSQGVFGEYVVTTVHDASGSVVLGEYPVTANADPQKFMAGVTYAARKSLMLAFGFRGDEDDDGNTAAKPAEKPEAKAKAEADKPKPSVSVGRLKSIAALMKSVSYDKDDIAAVTAELFGEPVDSQHMTNAQADALVKHLTALMESRAAAVVSDLGAEEVE
jgi:hypothetical protein